MSSNKKWILRKGYEEIIYILIFIYLMKNIPFFSFSDCSVKESCVDEAPSHKMLFQEKDVEQIFPCPFRLIRCE